MTTPLAGARATHLIAADELRSVTESGVAPLILDVRWELAGSQPDDFARGHIPGALFVDLEADLSDHAQSPESAGRHPIPHAEAFTGLAASWGLTTDRDVVAMDNSGSVAASRLWWLLKYFGHDRVRVLDGGWRSWSAIGAPGETGSSPSAVAKPDETSESQPEPFVAVAGHMPTISLDDVDQWIAGGVLIDARARERYLGQVEPVDPVAGHIPGAINLPTMRFNDADGRFVSDAQIQQAVEAAGIDGTRPVATSCGSGVTAAHQVLALSLIGITATLFPGSYSQWCRTPGLPIAGEDV